MSALVNNPELLAVGYGLGSAAVWGAGDFCGGLASRRGNLYGVVLVSQAVGLVCFLALALGFEGGLPPARDLMFGAFAGVAGLVGLLALYAGLARGRMGVVAPITAVLSALVPVAVGIVTEGAPPALVLVGFGLAVTAVWLLSGGGDTGGIRREEFGLALVAGLGFALFFISIDRISEGSIFWPLAFARIASVPLLVLFLLVRGKSGRGKGAPLPGRVWLLVVMAGLLDSGGNLLFALAAQAGRLDISAVLASLYPGSTVLLAWLVLKESLGRRQGLGIVVALAALVLIAV